MWKYMSLFVICFSIFEPTWSESGNDTFVPTAEWQIIKEGQSIPAGLHVRINLETGKKEAKLINENESKKELSVIPDSKKNAKDLSSTDGKDTTSKISKELENALKNIPSNTYDDSSEKLEDFRRKYKTYDEIKKDFQELNMKIRTDSEIITNLIEEYKNSSKDSVSVNRYISILEDINYLVHQIDNSLWFIQKGGLDLILLPMIVNQTDEVLRTKSLRILGALTQNNPKAQISVFERNFGNYLSQILITSSNSEELSTCLYAFGSLLRKFPYAQKQMLSKYGTKALISVMNRDTDLKIKIKTMTFIGDLLIEKEYALNMLLEPDNYDRMKQYEEVHFESWLKDSQFCDTVVDFIVKSQNQLVVNTDLADYLVQSLQITQKICFETWSENSVLKHTLYSIKERFEGTEEEYLLEIAQKLDELNNILFTHYNSPRDEL